MGGGGGGGGNKLIGKILHHLVEQIHSLMTTPKFPEEEGKQSVNALSFLIVYPSLKQNKHIFSLELPSFSLIFKSFPNFPY